MASSDPLDVMDPPVDGLSHITLVAPTADLFYSTVQFYESLGFKAVCLVSNPCSLQFIPPFFFLSSILPLPPCFVLLCVMADCVLV
jgi:hypothetical protein